MKNDFILIDSKRNESHDYIFFPSGEIREAYSAIIARRLNDDKMEIGVALIDMNDCIIYYFESDRIIQLYRAMNILHRFTTVSEASIRNCFLIASRRFSNQTRSSIHYFERSGIDIFEVQSNVFTHSLPNNEFYQIMDTINELNIDIDSSELQEEITVCYIPQYKVAR